jgi:hypothetical protein
MSGTGVKDRDGAEGLASSLEAIYHSLRRRRERARAGCAFARCCPAAAHGSICPAASLGPLGAEGDSQGHRRPRWVGGNGYILAARAR